MSRDTYECPKCSWSGFPAFVLGDSGRLVAQCKNPEKPDCLFTERALGPADFSHGVAAVAAPGTLGAGTLGEPGWEGKTSVLVDVGRGSPVVPAGSAAAAHQFDKIVDANNRRRRILDRIHAQHRALHEL